MGSPKTLALTVGAFFSVLLAGVVWVSSKPISEPTKPSTPVLDVSSGDTNNEVLRTVIANQQRLQKQNDEVQSENKKLSTEGMTHLQEAMDNFQKSLKEELQKTQSTLENQVQSQQQTLNTLQEQVQNVPSEKNNPYPVHTEHGIALQMIGDVQDLSQYTQSTTIFSPNTKSTVEPNFSANAVSFEKKTNENASVIPYYTIPANSTLNRVSMMTSLIGEVPVSGHLLAPAFPFKAIVGRRDLFAANGLSLPTNISGMVLEGYSVGNMTMSCVRAYVTRALFVFNDGHFVVYPSTETSDATQLYPRDALGYLSDPYGNTCISGRYISDAPRVITNLAALGGVTAGAEALAQAQMSTINTAFQSQTKVTGNMAKYLGGSFVSGGSQRALDWYTNRVSDVFDAVFIPATLKNPRTHHIEVMQLVFNVTQTILIDFNTQGRTLRYENPHQGTTADDHLD